MRLIAGALVLAAGAACFARPAAAASRVQEAASRAAAVASTSAQSAEVADDDLLDDTDSVTEQQQQQQQQRQGRRRKLPADTVRRKKGRRFNASESRVPDPAKWLEETNEKLGSFWRPDVMKRLTYTQFWTLVEEGRVEKVVYDLYERNCFVTTKDSAPGGARTEKVTLPYDPALHAHLVEHGVEVRALNTGRQMELVQGITKAATPFAMAALLIGVLTLWPTFTAKLDQLHGGTIRRLRPDTTFKDIAGLEEVKGEVQEVIEFLRNPKKFDRLGARSPLGVLLAGPPGTGKTLLARAIAGESKVPFFSVAGSEFEEVFVGVGAARVRGMFKKARDMAPCILFIDEFDGMAKKRSSANQSPLGQQDDSVQTINQLLTEMDGFENNRGVVFIAATNRPGVLDDAVVRAGRFDRIIHLTHPSLDARVDIMKIHMRDKEVDPDLDIRRLARACAGFTGAEIMGLMNRAATIAVRNRQKAITEDTLFQAIEVITAGKAGGTDDIGTEVSQVPPILRRTIAVYYAAKALLGELSPGFDELAKVAVCPNGQARGFTYCIPSEDRLEAGLLTRSFMETRMVIGMAGRCAERLVLGPGSVSSQGDEDVREVHHIAREMIFCCGFSASLGPVALMEPAKLGAPHSDQETASSVPTVGNNVARIALEEVDKLVQAAEAKAYYGLTHNHAALQALTQALLDKGALTGAEVRDVLSSVGTQPFAEPYIRGYGWGYDGHLVYPGQDGVAASNGAHLPEKALKSAADDDYSSADLDKRLHSEIPDSQRASLADILESRYLLDLQPSTFS